MRAKGGLPHREQRPVEPAVDVQHVDLRRRRARELDGLLVRTCRCQGEHKWTSSPREARLFDGDRDLADRLVRKVEHTVQDPYLPLKFVYAHRARRESGRDC